MSRLTVSSATRQFTLNVVGFNSPMYGTLSGTQTKTVAVWFPTKMTHPDITFDVVFVSESEYESFQQWVRAQQLLASLSTKLITLNWPERNILNWTGIIGSGEAGGQRFNVAPQARFTVTLVDSLITSRTEFASIAYGWQSVFGAGVPGAVQQPPTAGEVQTLLTNFGAEVLAGLGIVSGGR